MVIIVIVSVLTIVTINLLLLSHSSTRNVITYSLMKLHSEKTNNSLGPAMFIGMYVDGYTYVSSSKYISKISRKANTEGVNASSCVF